LASVRTVVVAIGANLVVAIAKLAAAVVTASTALAAEAAHALADTGNEGLLLLAQVRSRRPADARHVVGYGRDAYFWALIASLGVFLAAAFFSVRVGIEALVNPPSETSFVVAYVVLALSAVFDGVSLVTAVRQLRAEARVFQRDFLDEIHVTSDPTIRAVFVEDAGAIVGDVVAFVGLLLHQITGSPTAEGIAAIVIGAVVATAAVQLARRNRDFLLGEQASPATRARIARYVLAEPGVVALRDLAVTFVGPHRVWVAARIDVDDSLTAPEVEALVRSLESGLKSESPFIARADIVPIG